MGRVWRTWVVLLFFAMGTSLITPLIPLYQQDLGFNDTVVFSTMGAASLSAGGMLYALGWQWTNLLSLVLVGLIAFMLIRVRAAAPLPPQTRA